ncbi:MAG: hypothetical protein ACYCZX_06280 [Rhodospirillaceae bacterium]
MIAVHDGAHGQFRLERSPELAHKDKIQRRMQSSRDRCGHRHAAAGESEDNGILGGTRDKSRGKQLTCLASGGENLEAGSLPQVRVPSSLQRICDKTLPLETFSAASASGSR